MPSSPTRQIAAFDSFLAVLKTPALAADLASQPDFWTEIKRLAEVHRLSGVLAHSTSRWLPASERAWRDRILMMHHRKHQVFLRQLRAILDAFDTAGIACVALKGPLLAERFHAVPFLKTSHDLDLLVRHSDIPAAARLMATLGFRLRGSLPWRVHQRYQHDVQFSGDGEVPLVEVHYALKAGANLIPAGEFVDRAVHWRTPGPTPDGSDFQVLSPADEAFYLVIHAAGHAFHRLRWLYDALALAKTLDASEKARVRSLALEMQLTGYFVAADMACREFFGEPLPLDLSGLSRPWLWSPLQTRHLRTMAQREVYSFGIHSLDVCRMSGSPMRALRLCLQYGRVKVPTMIYRWRGGPAGPDLLARTIRQQAGD